MAKKQIIDIEAEFEGFELDEHSIKIATGMAKRSENYHSNPDAIEKRKKKNADIINTDEWKSKINAATEIRKNDPIWQEKNKIANQEKWKSKETKEKHLAGVRKATQNPNWREKVVKNNKAKVNDVEHRQRHQIAIDKRGQGDWYEKNARKNTLTKSKPIVTPFGVFSSRIVAVKTLTDVTNIGGKINKGIKEKDSGYYYISKEEYIMLTGQDI